MLAPTPCREPGCYALATKAGACSDHTPAPFFSSTRGGRLPKDWRARRLIVLKRDQGICYLCGGPGADRVDHVIPNDDHALSNLKAVHDSTPPHCHRFKSSQEGTQALLGNRIKKRI